MSGTVGSVSATLDREFVVLCDDQGGGVVVPFLRRYTSTAAGVVAADYELDGATAYAPTGSVVLCQAADVAAAPASTHGVQDTDWTLAANPTAQSVTLSVLAGAVTVTTPEGNLTVGAGTVLTWSALAPDGVLTGTLAIDGTAPGASWQVIWTALP